MNCKDVARALSQESPLLHQAQDHVRGCNRCQELVLSLDSSVPLESPSLATLRQIEEAMAVDLRPVHPVAPARYYHAAFVGIFGSLVALAVYRLGAFAIAVMTPLQISAILSTLAIGTGLLASSLVHQMVPGSAHRVSPKRLPVAITIWQIVAIAVAFKFQHERDFWGNAWACIRVGIPIGALAAGLFWLVLRRGAILSPSMTGAATGLLAGLVGASVLEIHCPNLDALHILVSHLGVAILCAMAGLFTGLTAEIIGGRSIPRNKQECRAPSGPL